MTLLFYPLDDHEVHTLCARKGLRVNCVSNQGFLRQYFVSGFFATALGKVFIATVPRVFFHTVSPEPVFLWTSARCCLLRWCFLRQ